MDSCFFVKVDNLSLLHCVNTDLYTPEQYDGHLINSTCLILFLLNLIEAAKGGYSLAENIFLFLLCSCLIYNDAMESVVCVCLIIVETGKDQINLIMS